MFGRRDKDKSVIPAPRSSTDHEELDQLHHDVDETVARSTELSHLEFILQVELGVIRREIRLARGAN